MSYVCNNNIIVSWQHGFFTWKILPNKLINYVDLYYWGNWQNNYYDVIYLDLAKAFVSVPHKRLIYKLSKYGITGNLLHWIGNFLSKRRQYVRVNLALSEEKSVISGVPQRSILGPILFIFYTNDLPTDIIAK